MTAGCRAAARLVAAVCVVGALGACVPAAGAVPDCEADQRLALVAQSVPGAAYVPCIRDLPQGWSATGFDPARGATSFRLVAERGDARPVRVELRPRCDVAGAVATTPRGEGVRTYLHLRSISPRYAGTLSDVFPGGCTTYRFDFARGDHIPLMEELQSAVGLFSRRELRLGLERDLGVELDP